MVVPAQRTTRTPRRAALLATLTLLGGAAVLGLMALLVFLVYWYPVVLGILITIVALILSWFWIYDEWRNE